MAQEIKNIARSDRRRPGWHRTRTIRRSISKSLGRGFIKSFPKVHPAVENGLAMLIGTVLLLVLSVSFGETWAMPAEPETTAALAYLIVGGSIIVFALFLFIRSRWTVSAASYQFVLTPFITFPAAAWLLGERLTLPMLLGAVGVVAGVYIGAIHPTGRKEATVPAQCGPDVMVRHDLPEARAETVEQR